MSSEKATAIVLHSVDFSESSSVVTLFTREFGKIRGMAKGARRVKGPFEGALDLLALCRIVFLRKSSDALDLLTEAKLERRFRPTGGDLSSLYAAYYVAELLGELTDDYDPHPELFDAAATTLAALEEHGGVANSILRFEMTALRVLGHLPSLDGCVECGKPVSAERRVAFSPLAGGVLCPSCRTGKRQVISLSAEVLAALVRFADPRDGAWREHVLARGTYGELRGVLNNYMAHLLGHRLKMPEYLKGLANERPRGGMSNDE